MYLPPWQTYVLIPSEQLEKRRILKTSKETENFLMHYLGKGESRMVVIFLMMEKRLLLTRSVSLQINKITMSGNLLSSIPTRTERLEVACEFLVSSTMRNFTWFQSV